MNSMKAKKHRVQVERRKFIPRQNSPPFWPSVKKLKLSTNNHIVGLVPNTILLMKYRIRTPTTNGSDVSRSLQSWVSTIQSVVLTADVFIFYEIRLWNVANILREPLRRPDLTGDFCMAFGQLWNYLRHLDLLRPKIYSAEKERKPTPEFTSRRIHALCKISLLQSAWTFRHLSRKHVYFV